MFWFRWIDYVLTALITITVRYELTILLNDHPQVLCSSSLKLFKSTPLSLTAMINTALSEALPNNRERRVKHCAVSRGCSLRCVAGIAVSHRSARGLAPSLRRKALISPVSQAWPSMCVIFLCAVRNGLLHVSRSRSLQLPCHFRRHHQAGIRAGAGERKGAYKSRFKNMEIDISFHCNHVVDWCQWVYACFGAGAVYCAVQRWTKHSIHMQSESIMRDPNLIARSPVQEFRWIPTKTHPWAGWTNRKWPILDDDC